MVATWDEILQSLESSKALIGASPSRWKLLSKELSDLKKELEKGGGITQGQLGKLKRHWISQRPFIDIDGRFFVLYIYDQGGRQWFGSRHGEREYKFHFCWCSTLEGMSRAGRRGRYKAKYDVDNDSFNVATNYSGGDTRKKLEACRNCLREMNFRGYADNYNKRNEIYNEFNLKNFFDEHGQQGLLQPTHQYNTAGYTKDWEIISREKRERSGFRCFECKKSKEECPDIVLQVHHLNGVKSDNRDSNLVVLCKECHKKKPCHSHMV